MTATEQLAAVQAQLNESLLRKEQLTGELETVNTRITALRNVIEGVRLGSDVIRESAEAHAAAQRAAEEVSAQ